MIDDFLEIEVHLYMGEKNDFFRILKEYFRSRDGDILRKIWASIFKFNFFTFHLSWLFKFFFDILKYEHHWFKIFVHNEFEKYLDFFEIIFLKKNIFEKNNQFCGIFSKDSDF